MKKLTTEEYIEKSRSVHENKYDYLQTKYTGTSNNITITCPEHGEFKQRADHHLQGHGCQRCGKITERRNVSKNRLIKKFEGLVQPEEYKLVPLTQGKYAKVDNEDFDKVKNINWAYSNGYAYSKEWGLMHRYIMNAPDYLDVDHIHHNTLDNRKSELRLATPQQNIFNNRTTGGTSKYKGVSFCKSTKRWRATIGFNYEYITIGYFNEEKSAAIAYNKKAVELFGEFAYLNKIPGTVGDYNKDMNNKIENGI